jgi:probable HAF family extracellular repeat protein
VTMSYKITDLGVLPGGGHAMAQSVRAGGRVVGSAQSGAGLFLAFLYAADGFPFLGAPLNGMVELGTLGGLTSIGTSINSAGHIVGDSETAAGTKRAFFSNPAGATSGSSLLHDMGSLGGPNSSAAALNDSDLAVGAADTAAGTTHEVVYLPNGLRDLGTLGGANSGATAINATGWVTGAAETMAGEFHAFLWRGVGALQDLGTLGGRNSTAAAVNSAGQVAGSAENAAGVSRAFLWTNGVMKDLGALGGTSSAANGINDAGLVVGHAETAGGDTRAYLYNGALIDLNTLIPPASGWQLVDAAGLNSAGQITGSGMYQGLIRGFLLTPA